MSKDIEALLGQLTLEEKATLLAGADFWHTIGIPRAGVPVLKVTDGPVGARGQDFSNGPASACFPCGTALASTWNPDLVQRVGQALAEEVKAKGAHVLLAPTINIHRHPLAGRNFECYSEDPYLTARAASAYITGLQSQGVSACVKHFVANDSEFRRRSMSSDVDERPLREIYLRPFELVVRDAKPWAVMSSYNRVNGVHASENDTLLLDILKGEWDFDGLLMSDWFGTYSPKAASGGLDLEMPGPTRWMGQHVLDAVASGALSEARLNDKVRRLLRLMDRAGVFDQPDLQPEQAIDRPEHHAVARQAASEAIVLLKNDQATLPLSADKLASIAVIGVPAEEACIMGGGSAKVIPHYVVTPLDGLRGQAGDRIAYSLGCPIHRLPPSLPAAWLPNGLTLSVFDNAQLAGAPVHTEVTDNVEWTWHAGMTAGADPTNFSVRLTGALRVPHSGVYEFSLNCIGNARLTIDGQPIVSLWERPMLWEDPGQTGSVALDGGRDYALMVEYRASDPEGFGRLNLGGARQAPADSIEQAAALAAQSDVAVVFAGLTPQWESEGFDRADMDLPCEQNQLIEAVAAANPKTVVVLNTGSPVHMPWLDRVAAVVQAWYLGQETGNAIADVLFGIVNPSGRLPTSFPKRLQDSPAYINFPGENDHLRYGEGLFVGYRYYDARDVAPLFPFGYGLSYTTFEYSNLKVTLAADGTVQVSVDVTNSGQRAGQEVAQVYVRDPESRLVRPPKELKGFAKVTLAPGETKTVSVTLDLDAFAYYDPAGDGWTVEAGEFEILVGASARDIRADATFTYTV